MCVFMKKKDKKMNKYTQTYLKNNDKNPFDKNSEYINPFLLDQSSPFSCPKSVENVCPMPTPTQPPQPLQPNYPTYCYKSTHLDREQINNISESELRADFEEAWPKLSRLEDTREYPYLDSNCYATCGTGHLIDLNNLEKDPLLNLTDEQKQQDFLNTIQNMKNDICKMQPNGRLGTKWDADKQKDSYSGLQNFPINTEKDKEIAWQHVKERFSQLRQAMNTQNPPVLWRELTPDAKYPLIDISYNPGVNTPVFNYAKNKTMWPNLFDAYAQQDYAKAQSEVNREGVGTRNDFLKDCLGRENSRMTGVPYENTYPDFSQ